MYSRKLKRNLLQEFLQDFNIVPVVFLQKKIEEGKVL